MRIFNRETIKEFAEKLNYGPEPDTIAYMVKKGKKVSEVQVKMEERIAGQSYLNFSKSVLYMLRMMVSLIFIQNFREK